MSGAQLNGQYSELLKSATKLAARGINSREAVTFMTLRSSSSHINILNSLPRGNLADGLPRAASLEIFENSEDFWHTRKLKRKIINEEQIMYVRMF